MNNTVRVHNLHKAYGEVQAVDNLCFDVNQGQIFGLLGPNGAGKTTTIECLLGLRTPDAGTIELISSGQDASNAAVRARVGVQLQTTGLLDNLTVREQVQLFAGLFPNPLPTEKVITLVSLEEKAKTATKNLSGGQKQRLAVALALINDPDLIFLDEPTTGLDPQARRRMWQVIANLKDRGKTIILTTHYMEEAEFLCDRVAIMDHGEFIADGSPAEMVNEHFVETAIEFVAINKPDQRILNRLPAVTNVQVNSSEQVPGFPTNGNSRNNSQDSVYMLYSTDVPRTMAGLFELVESDELIFSDMTVRQATLEDVFLKLTGRRIRK